MIGKCSHRIFEAKLHFPKVENLDECVRSLFTNPVTNTYVDIIVQILQIKYAELQRLPPSGKIRTTPNDTFTPYAEIC